MPSVLGPIDTDMNRGFEIPKASPESAAQRIFDGLEEGEEDIFPDPASAVHRRGLAQWRGQGARAAVRRFRAEERGEFGMMLRMLRDESERRSDDED